MAEGGERRGEGEGGGCEEASLGVGMGRECSGGEGCGGCGRKRGGKGRRECRRRVPYEGTIHMREGMRFVEPEVVPCEGVVLVVVAEEEQFVFEAGGVDVDVVEVLEFSVSWV